MKKNSVLCQVTLFFFLVGLPSKVDAQEVFTGNAGPDWTQNFSWLDMTTPFVCTGSDAFYATSIVINFDADMGSAGCGYKSEHTSGTVTVSNGVIWRLNHGDASHNFTSAAMLQNNGTIAIASPTKLSVGGGASVTNFGTIQVAAGAEFEYSNAVGGTIVGDGTLRGTATVSGIVHPGDVGTVGTLSTALAPTFTGSINIDVDGMGNNDKVASSGGPTAATISGATVHFVFVGGHANGTKFQVFNGYGSVTAPAMITTNNGYTMQYNGSGEFEILSGGLPVELVDFWAQPQDAVVALTWNTVSETNNAGFQVQRSFDGVNWHELRFVSGQGTTQKQQLYTYVDEAPNPGSNYYRLKQVDYDGGSEYSKVVRAAIGSQGLQVTMGPNPAKQRVRFKIAVESVEGGSLTLYNIVGKPVRVQAMTTCDEEMSLAGLPAGIYTIVAEQGSKQWKERLIIQD